MGLLEIASSKSVWRGIEYCKSRKVLSWGESEVGIYDGTVEGSGEEPYSVHVDTVHPRNSTCNCPLANGKKTICKHIIAVYMAAQPSEEKRFKSDLTPYESEEEEWRAKRYKNLMSWARNMSARELREAYVEAMIHIEEMEREKKKGK